MAKDVIRIGNAGGYWGDDPTALKRQIEGGSLDYVSMDFLAEITMSIMQKQKSRSEEAGYAKDFLPMLKSVLKKVMADGTKIITNAGGINPISCAKAIYELGLELGLRPKIGIVHGDDIMDRIDALQKGGAAFTNMETFEDFSKVKDRLEAANIYFGVAPVAEILKEPCDLVITGRVTDTGITLAPMVHEFSWSLTDWDKMASGIVAGHILECGSQSTGGNFTDWHKVESFHNMGFPIVEMRKDGSFVVTKHENSGGLVSVDTVREQLFYEMGDPRAYLTPDVVADFSSIKLEADGKNRVLVSGIKGWEPTPLYKVSMAYRDGYKCQGSVVVSGPKARKKAEAFADIFWGHCGELFAEGDKETEYFGWNACQRSLTQKDDGNEILLKLGVRSDDKAKLRTFAKWIPAIILGGPPGVAVSGGVPKPQEIVSYWPALIEKDLVAPKIGVLVEGKLGMEREVFSTPKGGFEAKKADTDEAFEPNQSVEELLKEQEQEGWRPLSSIALARSGDKGDTSNIGVLARSKEAYDFLGGYLTSQKMKNYFQELCFGKVTRYELPNLKGYNFLLDEALGGGGTRTLRTDAQGKTYAQAILAQKAPIPDKLLE